MNNGYSFLDDDEGEEDDSDSDSESSDSEDESDVPARKVQRTSRRGMTSRGKGRKTYSSEEDESTAESTSQSDSEEDDSDSDNDDSNSDTEVNSEHKDSNTEEEEKVSKTEGRKRNKRGSPYQFVRRTSQRPRRSPPDQFGSAQRSKRNTRNQGRRTVRYDENSDDDTQLMKAAEDDDSEATDDYSDAESASRTVSSRGRVRKMTPKARARFMNS